MCQHLGPSVQEGHVYWDRLQARLPVLTLMASSGFVIIFCFQEAVSSFSAAVLCHRPIRRRTLRLVAILDAAEHPGNCYNLMILKAMKSQPSTSKSWLYVDDIDCTEANHLRPI